MTIIFPERDFKFSNRKVETSRKGIFIDPTFKYNLDNYLIKGVEHGHDAIVLVTGLEGSGKSSFTQLIASYCDNTHNISLDRVVFTGKDLMRAIDISPIKTAIIFDEAIMDMSTSDSATEMQKILIKKFTLIRKKRLFIFIVIPSIFMLRRYFAIFRTRCMINCYCPDGITRGFFRFYSFSTKKSLYLKGYKEMDMGCVKPDFKGRFVNSYGRFIDANKYEQKKDEAILSLTDKNDDKEHQLKEQFQEIKVKVKLELEQYKNKLIEKNKQFQIRQMNLLTETKKKYKDMFEDLRSKSSTIRSQRDKQMIEEIRIRYIKLLYFCYNQLKNQLGTDFTYHEYRTLLLNDKITGESYQKITQDIKEGERLSKL